MVLAGGSVAEIDDASRGQRLDGDEDDADRDGHRVAAKERARRQSTAVNSHARRTSVFKLRAHLAGSNWKPFSSAGGVAAGGAKFTSSTGLAGAAASGSSTCMRALRRCGRVVSLRERSAGLMSGSVCVLERSPCQSTRERGDLPTCVGAGAAELRPSAMCALLLVRARLRRDHEARRGLKAEEERERGLHEFVVSRFEDRVRSK